MTQIVSEAEVEDISTVIIDVFARHKNQDRVLQGEIIRAMVDFLERVRGQKLIEESAARSKVVREIK